MLYAIVAKPGQGKSYFAVTKIYELQQQNIENLKKNIPIYFENKQLLEDRDLLKKDTTFTYELGDQVFSKTVNYDFFIQFEDEEQFEDYFQYYFFYNKYIEQLFTDETITLTKLLPVKQIYSNINGLKIDGVLPMPLDLDWRSTPFGSIHFIDEIRDHPPYNWDGRKVSESPIIKGMSKVRHTDKDVWLITQDAEDYNYSLRQLIDKLYFLKRPPQNPQACGIYVFDQFISRPRSAVDSKQDPKKYVEFFLLPYKKKYQRLYVSASSHTSMKFRIPWKVFGYILLFLMIVTIVLVGFLNIPIFKFFGSAISQMSGKEESSLDLIKNGSTKSSSKTATPETDLPNGFDPNTECRKGINVEKPICVQWFNDFTKNQNDSKIQQVKYNPNDPFNHEDIQNQITYEVTQKPVFSGCMKQGSKYIAYTQQGTKLSVSASDCQKLIDDGDRPFNYFKQDQQIAVQANPNQLQQAPVSTMQN